MATISDMPAEIIIKISHSLTTKELGNLRLTNKRTEAATFQPFVREFFLKKQFMITEFSLQTLIDISEHPHIGPQLSHVVLGLDGYPEGYPVDVLDGGDPSTDQIDELTTRRSAQRCLMASGVARDMLAHAFRRLSGLKTVDIRDFSSNTRDRDRGAWRSYGSVAAQEATGMAMDMRFGVGPNSAIIFPLVIQALASAQRTGVGIEVVLRSRGEGLPDSAFALFSFNRDQTLAVVEGLRKLHIDLRLSTNDTIRTPDEASLKDKRTGPFLRTSHLQVFLSHASGLEWLRVNMRRGDPHQSVLLLNWIALPRSMPPPVPGHFVAPLKQLDLGDVTARRSLYWNIIRKFKDTLEAVSIWNSSMEITVAHYEDRIDQWTQLFNQITGLPHIKEVTFGRLRVSPDYPTAGPPLGPYVCFGTTPVERETHYRGDNAPLFLQQLAARARMDWDVLKPLTHDAAAMDYDEDEEDEEDGMGDESDLQVHADTDNGLLADA
ncbi:hypothetical protein MAPG_05916 [Magnaporthiopsis poae ATCC 64411]|uniref:F-box domain-containing protein n=1 Tax=Magnaporthiopsis poae (strain ATCC 64411 / 73-15) TaxID=644358 RepID=A0A0C4E0N5_MAGP6|nr:hypothetical protein MAPG_05916 [Magnaporthiopsis poae ATCC 64411]